VCVKELDVEVEEAVGFGESVKTEPSVNCQRKHHSTAPILLRGTIERFLKKLASEDNLRLAFNYAKKASREVLRDRFCTASGLHS